MRKNSIEQLAKQVSKHQERSSKKVTQVIVKFAKIFKRKAS